jgi:hypothetical protein
MIRKGLTVGLTVFVTNMILFLMIAPFFLNKVHHHWIIPVLALWFMIESAFIVRLPPTWSIPALRVVTILILLMAALLFWRQFSMFQCFRHCEGRLTVGLLLLSAAQGIAWRFGPFHKSRWILTSALLFLTWAAIVGAIGFAQSTWNFS